MTGDIAIFRTVEEAERYLEPPAVEDGQTIVYDREGRHLSLEVLSEPDSKFLGITMSAGIERITIGREESLPVNGDELRQLLTNFLVRIGEAQELFHHATLEDVLDKAVTRLGFTR